MNVLPDKLFAVVARYAQRSRLVGRIASAVTDRLIPVGVAKACGAGYVYCSTRCGDPHFGCYGGIDGYGGAKYRYYATSSANCASGNYTDICYFACDSSCPA